MLEDICRQAEQAAEELIEKAKLHPGQIVVIGCSTSEICGSRIGSDSRPEVAEQVFVVLHRVLTAHGLYLAAQCCEHLNRAIIIEREAVPGADIVNVVPQPEGGRLVRHGRLPRLPRSCRRGEHSCRCRAGYRRNAHRQAPEAGQPCPVRLQLDHTQRHPAGGPRPPEVHRRCPRRLRSGLAVKKRKIRPVPRIAEQACFYVSCGRTWI